MNRKYECNNLSCRPCQHIELDDVCPSCLNNRLILSPKSNWIFCPNFYTCEWEMNYTQYQNDDIDLMRQNTIKSKVEIIKNEISMKKEQLVELECQLDKLLKK